MDNMSIMDFTTSTHKREKWANTMQIRTKTKNTTWLHSKSMEDSPAKPEPKRA
jgi:hypothetical protein